MARVYRYKNPCLEFFCPLCGSSRAFNSTYKLGWRHYGQIAFIGLVIAGMSYSTVGVRGIFFVFPVWIGFELFARAFFRGEIPCPHCGFDASWYQRDVRVSREKVKKFWEKKKYKNK